jgi:hypothetical protein
VVSRVMDAFLNTLLKFSAYAMTELKIKITTIHTIKLRKLTITNAEIIETESLCIY